MGDRTNPIKFGPEWLRNLALQRSIRTNPGTQAGGTGTTTTPPGMGGAGVPPPPRTSAANPTPRVTLARLRYCREEMLALYDRQTAEAPAQLKAHDTLYVPRGQPPYASSNSFEDENRDNTSRQASVGSVLLTGDRYTPSGRGRGLSHPETKSVRGLSSDTRGGKTRGGYRVYTTGRAWTRNAFPEDEQNQAPRPWTNTNHQPSTGLRPNNGEQPDWQNKQQQYRIKRQTSTNWRQQHGRDDGEEWRSADGARRPQDKWAEWGWQQEPSNRPNQEKQWHNNNRRTWMGSEGNEDALPEWAVENSEACGGTFDASGAFHGYSNDDSNIPKTAENPYPLTKSHTHGSFARSKMPEEGYEEWWVSEKAKKLSPKRFDPREYPFKKQSGPVNIEEKTTQQPPLAKSLPSNGSSSQNNGAIPKKVYQPPKHILALRTVKDPARPSPSQETEQDGSDRKTPSKTTPEHKEFNQKNDILVQDKVGEPRPTSDQQSDKGNFQSVILTSNNTLRQKHQNIVVSPAQTPTRKLVSPFFASPSQANHAEVDSETDTFKGNKESDSNKIVDDIIQMTLEDFQADNSYMMNPNASNATASKMSYRKSLPHVTPKKPKSNRPMEFLANQNKPLPTAMPPHETYNGNMSQPIGITNTMLNASLGLPLPNSSASLPQPVPSSLTNTGLSNPTLGSGIPLMGGNKPGFQQEAIPTGLQLGIENAERLRLRALAVNVPNSPVGCVPNTPLQTPPMMMYGNAMPYPEMPPLVEGPRMDNAALEQIAKEYLANYRMNIAPYIGNIMNTPLPQMPNLGMQQPISDQWYYEDPNKTIQGPFSSLEMYHWYKAGFFNQALMVRREAEAAMRPLGSYGPNPFGNLDVPPPFHLGGGFDLHPQQGHENLIEPQPGLGVDGLTSNGCPPCQPHHMSTNVQYNPRNTKQFQISVTVNSAGPLRPRTYIETAPQIQYQLVQNNEVQSLWDQPTADTNAEHMWMPSMNDTALNDNPAKNLPLFFWDNQPADMPATPLMPETIKTEEEILAQMRAAQAQGPTSPLSFFAESPVAAPEPETNTANAAVNVNQLQKLIQKDSAAPAAADSAETEHQVPEKPTKQEQPSSVVSVSKASKVTDKSADTKPTKEAAKVDNKSKAKETSKSKNKKAKEEKKEETEVRIKDEETKVEKRSAEPSPSSKSKKEEKSNKKDTEKEKKEFLKDGFTLVKSSDRSKDSKKRAEEAKVAEEADRKRKEEEKLATEERKRQLEIIRRQTELAAQSVPTRHAMESISKKAPWLASAQGLQSTNRDGPTLAEIQRLEREKKLEQMKEQQQMMQIIAQQQAAALAREQEVQTGLGWAKKANAAGGSQSLSEIQAEARRQIVPAAPPVAEPAPSPVPTVPWSNVSNGGAGFWDCPTPEPKPVEKSAEIKPEPKQKKRVTVNAQPRRDHSPSAEFDQWCSTSLLSWVQSEIDVPTFVSFLKDIESPYEVKDYVKCYLGDTLESNDFARLFLEKRSRLLRVGMVTPSDDLCSPAVAVNPRSNAADHAELKTKGKKTKKNKMLKVDARNILGFSVTASEDRINVGDIDTV